MRTREASARCSWPHRGHWREEGPESLVRRVCARLAQDHQYVRLAAEQNYYRDRGLLLLLRLSPFGTVLDRLI